MASPEVLDFQRLLAPISEENPTGKDLRTDLAPKAIYREIKDARKKAADAERCHLYQGGKDNQGYPVPQPDWRPILQLAPQALAEQSKDLEIVALFTEAVARKHGFPGLRDGFRLARELVERYWEHLYPSPDEDGLRTRVLPLVRLNGEEGDGLLITPILRTPITGGGAAGAFSLSDYRQAVDLESIQDPDKRARRLEESGGLNLQTFEKAAAETPPQVFRDLLEDISQAWEEFRRLGETVEQRCGAEESGQPLVFPTSGVREALEACRDAVKRIAAPVLGLTAEGEEAMEGSEGAGAGPGAAGTDGASGRVRTREEAFRTLLQVAEFFKRTEPHSPVSYALEQAVRWGRMPLPKLLDELIPEDAARQQLFKLIGINVKPPEGQS